MSDYSEYIKPFLKAFDEACGKAFENGADIERKRIIKLLESIEGHGWIEIQFDKLIELIKGETNE
jgi:hypothetical protein